jgi:hypothetical protein
MTNLQAPSIIPVAMGQPFARALSYFVCWWLLGRVADGLINVGEVEGGGDSAAPDSGMTETTVSLR